MKQTKLNCPVLVAHQIIEKMMEDIHPVIKVPLVMEELFQRFVYRFKNEGDSSYYIGLFICLEKLGVLEEHSYYQYVSLANWYQGMGTSRPQWSKLRSIFRWLIRILGGHVLLCDHNGFVQCPDPITISKWKEVECMPAKTKPAPAMKKATKPTAKKVVATKKSTSKKSK